jgi:DNA-directed RNA polymerase subunit RPC12/RpoP
MAMQRQVSEPPVVQCPGCHQPMEPNERASVTDRLVDIRYVCAACGMATKRIIKEEAGH